MKKLSLIILAFCFVSCSTPQPGPRASAPDHASRKPATAGLDLTGTRLGHANHKMFHEGPNRAAVRIYFDKIEDEPGSYHAVLLEYGRLQNIAPQYLASRKFPSANKIIGYLNFITKEISVYKVIASGKAGTYEMHPLRVNGKNIEPVMQENPRLLVLADDATQADPLAGAKISPIKDSDRDIYFPVEGDNSSIQYKLAKFAYKKAKLDSTWRKSYLTGPYLAAYGKLDDVALKMFSEQGENRATFINNEALFDVSKKKRESIFTHPKSAFLEGTYAVHEPINGMFIMTPVGDGHKGSEHVVGRIGLFIDIFDATKALNQDVVEVAFINPNNAEDIMMYYEHPENGEGTGSGIRE